MSAKINRLLEVMAALRDPESGCPWDLVQTFETIMPYTLEETYELAEAIESGNRPHMKEELGDLFLQVVYHAQMAKEEGAFDFDDVVETVTDKMIRRHPHVFQTQQANTPEDVNVIWAAEKEKEKEKENKDKSKNDAGYLDNIPVNLPAMSRSQKLQAKAAKAGFTWDDIDGVLRKLDEEIEEMREAVNNNDQAAIKDELGDLYFVLVNAARMLDLDAEQTLRQANRKFCTRFAEMERLAAEQGKIFSELSLEAQEQLWQQAKKTLKQAA